ncbi:RNA 3'-terminal phosphate cyclase [Coccomyxa sp. Obi]|nr:RNA 3'-terminal phosphate cyclase [Coccomyxa sp. Obi]
MGHQKPGGHQHRGAQRERSMFSQQSIQLPKPEDAIHIDGSIKEGGGQILRDAAALSAIMCTPISVEKIRAGRPRPGLRPQHVAALRLVESLSSGRLSGGQESSSHIVLQPGALRCGSYGANTGTAGSCALLAQAALPCLLYASPTGGRDFSTLDLRGGTDAAFAPSVCYLQHILLPTLRRLLDIDVLDKLERRGFYPKGGGHMSLAVRCLAPGAKLPAFNLTQSGDVSSISVHAFTAGRMRGGPGEPSHVAERMVATAVGVLRQNLGPDVDITTEVTKETEESAFGDGAGMLMVTTTTEGCLLGASALAERSKTSEELGEGAAKALLEDIYAGGAVDCWLQDQLIVFMALADGVSSITCGRPTLHTETAIQIAETMTAAKFTTKSPTPGSQEPWTITCEGAAVAKGALG